MRWPTVSPRTNAGFSVRRTCMAPVPQRSRWPTYWAYVPAAMPRARTSLW